MFSLSFKLSNRRISKNVEYYEDVVVKKRSQQEEIKKPTPAKKVVYSLTSLAKDQGEYLGFYFH